MMRLVMARTAAALVLLVGLSSVAACGPSTRYVERSAARRVLGGGAAKAVKSRAVVRKDMLRDMATRAKRLPAPRSVFRYMSAKEARVVRTRGIAAGSHFTSTAGAGRPMRGVRAAKRYGLQAVPSHRVAAKLPAGTRVKMNKVQGGSRGIGEIKVMARVPNGQLKSDVRLPR